MFISTFFCDGYGYNTCENNSYRRLCELSGLQNMVHFLKISFTVVVKLLKLFSKNRERARSHLLILLKAFVPLNYSRFGIGF